MSAVRFLAVVVLLAPVTLGCSDNVPALNESAIAFANVPEATQSGMADLSQAQTSLLPSGGSLGTSLLPSHESSPTPFTLSTTIANAGTNDEGDLQVPPTSWPTSQSMAVPTTDPAAFGSLAR